jgi:flagellin-like hook-associated protein FlgL
MSSNIVLSSAVRQNLLSLQTTAQLLATTQTHLATGLKVNSAVEDPISFFTAQNLNTRASNISNLLNGISNGIQVLQAANTGITSLKSLVQNAQSIANQALQAPIGYSTKSNYSTTIGGATSSDLRGTITYTNQVAIGYAIAGPATAATTLSSLNIKDGNSLNVDGKTITFVGQAVPGAGTLPSGSSEVGNVVTDGNGNSTVYLGVTATPTGTIGDLLNAIDLATGTQFVASVAAGVATLGTATGGVKSTINGTGQLNISTGTLADLNISSTTALAPLGLAGNTNTSTSFTAARSSAPGSLSGKVLTFSSFNGGTAVSVAFGDGSNGTVKSLADLNAKLQADNLTASISTTGSLTISADNDFASSTLGGALGGVIGGTAVTGSGLTWTTPTAPVADPGSQATRANLVTQYNNILGQIDKTAQDASFNGINLLGGDQLQLVFNETGRSTLNITGTVANANGLGLANLASGVDFIDNNSTNKVLASLQTASSNLQSLASALGSNLSVVQTRQTFNASLVEVLQTGATNLTIADPNELAAQSQALTTRQAIAVSALALANQNQQSVLQLLR